MKLYLFPLLFLVVLVCTSLINIDQQDAVFDTRILASGLSDPWSIVVGPDRNLWVTESKGYRVLVVDPKNGKKIQVLNLNSERDFPSFQEMKKMGRPVPQGGLMGLALHPDFMKGRPFVYLSYVYKHIDGNHFLLKLARYNYNFSLKQLESPEIICDSIPASNDHNGGRMIISPIEGKPYLFYSVGDQGAGQFSNGGRENKAQQLTSYEGKILRFALEQDSRRSWIPSDNPIVTYPSAVWSWGHRNAQGLAFALIDGKERLYSSEHGPYSDDEVNLISKGKNYGHPLVIGYPDGNYNGLAASVSNESKYPGKWHTTYPFIHSEKANADSIGSNYREPLVSLYPTSGQELSRLFNSIQADKDSEWNSYAPSGISVYQSEAIPGWNPSLLVTSLKQGKLLRLKINRDGTIDPKVRQYASSISRYRDVTVSPDGRKIYLITDSSAVTSGPTAENPKSINQRGCIIELTYHKR